MRAVMWVLIAGAGAVSAVIGGCGAKAEVNTVTVTPSLRSVTMIGSELRRVCDDKGICCYIEISQGTVSCVATRLDINVMPGEIDDGSQGGASLSGEVSKRALEKRILSGTH